MINGKRETVQTELLKIKLKRMTIIAQEDETVRHVQTDPI